MQMKSTRLGGILAVLLALLFVPLAVASPDGATVTSVGNSRYTPNVAQTQNVVAGTIYDVNLNAASSTNYWSAVWGNVSGSVQLRNAAGKDFFTLNIGSGLPNSNVGQNIYSLVMAYNNAGTPNFGSLTSRSAASIDSVTGVAVSLTDSAANTFTQSFTPLVVGNQTVTGGAGSTFYGNSYNATSGLKTSADATYFTQVLNDTTNNLLFVSPAVGIVWTGGASKKLFDNVSFANYEMLLYSNNSGSGTATSYSFYLELR